MSEQDKWDRESGIFSRFLEVEPRFSGQEIVKWQHNKNESPDISSVDRIGNQVGIELTEWLHGKQTGDYAFWETILREVKRRADWTIVVVMDPFGRRCGRTERANIVSELDVLIDGAIARPQITNSGLSSFIINPREFREHAPTVAKFFQAVSGTKLGSGRLRLLTGGASAAKDSEIALQHAIRKKLHKDYAKIKRDRELYSLHLLVYYDLAVLKNTPGLDEDVSGLVATTIVGVQQHPFDAIFVLMFPAAPKDKRKVYRIPTEGS
jgi:hypothetical protein